MLEMPASNFLSAAHHYRVKAAEFTALAHIEKSRHLQLEYAKMAQSYLHLAQLAEKNEQTDLVYETPGRNLEPPSL